METKRKDTKIPKYQTPPTQTTKTSISRPQQSRSWPITSRINNLPTRPITNHQSSPRRHTCLRIEPPANNLLGAKIRIREYDFAIARAITRSRATGRLCAADTAVVAVCYGTAVSGLVGARVYAVDGGAVVGGHEISASGVGGAGEGAGGEAAGAEACQ